MSPVIDTKLIALALREDLPHGDATAQWLRNDCTIRTRIVARESCLLCGVGYIRAVYDKLQNDYFPHLPLPVIQLSQKDGDTAEAGTVIAAIDGPAVLTLAGERTVLNFLMRLSGLATHAEQLRQKFPASVTVLDTRKTTPGWRQAEKYAFRVGGLINHRHSLSQAAMLKDNHLPWLAESHPDRGPLDAVEIELDRPDQLPRALTLKPNALLLDNFSAEALQEILPQIPDSIVVELSGNVDPESFAQRYNQLPDDLRAKIRYVSLGRILQYASWADIAMDLCES